jgi:isoamylase
LLMGDEVRRTQRGNNNAYCQDNETSWFDWTLIDKHRDIHRFAKQLIALRMNRDLSSEPFDMTLNELLRRQPVQWHGVKLNAPDWDDESHTLAASARLLGDGLLLHIMNNAYWEALDFEIPALGDRHKSWRRMVDTFLDSPDDISSWSEARTVRDSTYSVQPRSVVILMSRSGSRIEPDHSAGLYNYPFPTTTTRS